MKGRLSFHRANLSELSPDFFSQIIFVCYIALFVGQGILVTASRKSGKDYEYNTITVVLLTEVVKLFLATACFLYNGTVSALLSSIRSNVKVLCLYLVPSFLYCIYNNLAFVNLSHFDPTTYFILLQLRVVITGIVFQIVFKKKLSRMQWASLVLLTSGCMVQQIDGEYFSGLFGDSARVNKDYFTYFLHLFFILVQTLCSCFAGVFNEHLLKDVGAKVNIFIQNIFMYLDSIFWNLVAIAFQGNGLSTFSSESFSQILKPLVIAIILNNSLVGITTSLFLKNLNSILKTFASAIELLFTAILSWIIFGVTVKFNTMVAIAIVSYSIYIYSRNPVINKPNPKTEEQKTLLEDV